jgi:O-antigen ligase
MLLPFSALLGVRIRYVISLILGVVLVSILAAGNFGWLSRASGLIVPDIVEKRLYQLVKHQDIAWRLGVLQCGLDLTREKPWLGWGIGNMAPECEQRLGHNVNHAHNLFLQLSSEVGLPGTFAFTVIFGFIYLSAWRAVFRLDDLQERILYGGLYLIAIAVVLLSQISLVVVHSVGLSVIFWSSLAISYSLTNHGHNGSARS